MRNWQIERRKRTRHLIELGGLVLKAGIVDLTGNDRATILGALLWMADKLKSEQGVRIPTQAGHCFRLEAGRDSDLMPATIPK